MNSKPISFESLSIQENHPVFQFDQINSLYEFETNIPIELIDEILGLPRESLIKDLEKVIEDATYRINYYESDKYKGKTWFVLHALFLLSELKAEESLNSILVFLQNDHDVLDFWMGDLLTEEIWAVIANCSYHKLDTLKTFMFMGGIFEYSKIVVGEAVTQLALNKIIDRKIAIQWHADVMQHYLDIKEYPICDPEINGSLVCNCLDLNAIELKPLIKKMFDENVVTRGWAGDWEEVNSEFQRTNQLLHTNKIEPIANIYRKWNDITNIHSTYEKQHQTYLDQNFHSNVYANQPFIKEFPKVGRNDLCPCGSGKKYKKCHGIE